MTDYDPAAGYGGAGQGHGQQGHGHEHEHEYGHGHGHGHEHEHGHEHAQPRYLRVFKLLRGVSPTRVRHGMHAYPVVDVYRLDSFRVALSADAVSRGADVRFYLYHTTDRRARVQAAPGIEPESFDLRDDEEVRIPFAEALRAHGVPCDDRRNLGDAVVEFWDALFSPPNDPFDETHYGNSPWMDRNMGDRRSIAELKDGGEWDDLWLLVRPRKEPGAPAVRVTQLGLDTVELEMMPNAALGETPVMVLLRA